MTITDDSDLIARPETGALLRTVPTERKAVTYAVSESELDMISLLNSLSVVFFSVGSALLTFALGLLMQAVLQEHTTSESWGIIRIVCPTLAVLASLSFGVATFALLKRGSVVGKMKREAIALG